MTICDLWIREWNERPRIAFSASKITKHPCHKQSILKETFGHGSLNLANPKGPSTKTREFSVLLQILEVDCCLVPTTLLSGYLSPETLVNPDISLQRGFPKLFVSLWGLDWVPLLREISTSSSKEFQGNTVLVTPLISPYNTPLYNFLYKLPPLGSLDYRLWLTYSTN